VPRGYTLHYSLLLRKIAPSPLANSADERGNMPERIALELAICGDARRYFYWDTIGVVGTFTAF